MAEWEDKLRHAHAYQQDVSGTTNKVPLTTENVRMAGQQRSSGNSSRSTRSSTSHDDSEFRHSHTTKTTRSTYPTRGGDGPPLARGSSFPGAGGCEEDVTITVTGKATLRIQGAEIQCEHGGEINIRGGGGSGGGIGGISGSGPALLRFNDYDPGDDDDDDDDDNHDYDYEFCRPGRYLEAGGSQRSASRPRLRSAPRYPTLPAPHEEEY